MRNTKNAGFCGFKIEQRGAVVSRDCGWILILSLYDTQCGAVVSCFQSRTVAYLSLVHVFLEVLLLAKC